MRRREFTALLGGTAVAWPLTASAQQRMDRPRRIGWLVGLREQDSETQRRSAIVIPALRDLGWVVGRNLQIDYRYTIVDNQRFDDQAKELIALGASDQHDTDRIRARS
jgi:putative tryptophan/tyrosine transport system substrate-binding protein